MRYRPPVPRFDLAHAAAILGCAAALLGPHLACDSPRRRPALRARDARVAVRTSTDAAGNASDDASVANEIPVAMAGPLRACVQRVERTAPPELVAALEAVEYTAAAEDACRSDMAPRLREPSLCDGIVLSAVRAQCRVRVAIARAEPDTCPAADGGDRGLDPVCLAIAAHDVSRCAAAATHDRTRCLAIARDDAAQCDTLDPLLRPRCRRDVTALHGLVPRMNGAPAVPGTLRLRVTPGLDGDASTGQEWTLDSVSRGAYIDASGTLFLVDPQRGWPSVFAPTLGHPLLAIALTLPARPGDATVTDARIVLTDGRVLAPSSPTAAGMVNITRVARNPGGRVAGSARLILSSAGAPYVVTFEFDTFIRDVVSRDALE